MAPCFKIRHVALLRAGTSLIFEVELSGNRHPHRNRSIVAYLFRSGIVDGAILVAASFSSMGMWMVCVVGVIFSMIRAWQSSFSNPCAENELAHHCNGFALAGRLASLLFALVHEYLHCSLSGGLMKA
ncbi:hypothetical protein [Desulfomicrobium norvegicum]|uniref:hypothetical protein n=1 Tax=Desulfomicrobium norvegicum (strain DSM 1741 / NCIMB 8310) TaxID=52561 RepID=UPI0012946956|nr:hypothetical protein [Desulfomicrobium norvegicum]